MPHIKLENLEEKFEKIIQTDEWKKFELMFKNAKRVFFFS